MQREFDVFLSYCSMDAPAVEAVARRLREDANLRPFLDRWDLIPGELWRPSLAQAISRSTAVAVFIGPQGPGRWQEQEVQLALQQADEYGTRVIPVLLPGASEESLGIYLRTRTWVNLADKDGFTLLISGIVGKAPGQSNRAHQSATRQPQRSKRATHAERYGLPRRVWIIRMTLGLAGISGGVFLLARSESKDKNKKNDEPLDVDLTSTEAPPEKENTERQQNSTQRPRLPDTTTSRGDPQHKKKRGTNFGEKSTTSNTATQEREHMRIEEGSRSRSLSESSPAASIVNSRSGVELIVIPSGHFIMGSSNGKAEERPPHRVDLDSFLLAKTPVTNRQYARYLKSNPDAPKPRLWDDNAYNQPDQPVVGVSWLNAKAFCEWAGLILPTESQWEYACRGGTTSDYYTGDGESDLARAGWYRTNSISEGYSSPVPVGLKEPNSFGLYDMHGNVWEFTRDSWSINYSGAEFEQGSGRRLKPGKPGLFVTRGGCHTAGSYLCRCSSRNKANTRTRPRDVGFRPARGIG